MDSEAQIEHFVRIVRCSRCSVSHCKKLLRDKDENVPQPGFVGRNYPSTRLMLLGQNPGIPRQENLARDKEYTAALRQLAHDPSREKYRHLQTVLGRIVPDWSVRKSYLSLIHI